MITGCEYYSIIISISNCNCLRVYHPYHCHDYHHIDCYSYFYYNQFYCIDYYQYKDNIKTFIVTKKAKF